ncbi:MAG TPA: hypothetical protein VF885_22135 [Arthrobacter sp.]
MTKSTIARTLGALIVVLGLLFGLAPAASAATPGHVSAHGVVVADGDYLDPLKAPKTPGAARACDAPSEGVSTSSNLPVNRWTDATAQLFWRLSNTAGLDTALIIQRQNVLSMGMSMGNTMWSLGTGMSAFAINFCVLDIAGGTADQVGATIAKTLGNSALLSFLVITSILVIMFKGRGRGRIDWKAIAMKGVVVGIFGAMLIGATASTGGGKDGSTANYRPGVMSPGWIVTTMNNTLASLASEPARALAVDAPPIIQSAHDGLSCANYVYQLKMGYQARYGTGSDAMASGVPMILSDLWEKTGLQTWRTTQFGTAVRNDGTRMDDNSWCRLLEFNAATKVTDAPTDGTDYGFSVRDAMMRAFAATNPAMTPDAGNKMWDSPAFNPTSNKDIMDHSLIAWAACIYDGGDPANAGSWNIRSEFNQGDKDQTPAMNKYKPADCAGWYTGGSENHADAFDWTQNGDNVTGRTTDPALDKNSAKNVRDFIQYLHGNTNTAGSAAIIVYNIAALAMLAVFGLLAMAIIIAKVAMIIMIIMAFFVCLAALLPNGNMDKLTGFLKTLLGMNMFIFSIQLIFALISVITKMLSDAGNRFLGDNELVSTIWTGFSPLLAVFLINMMVTKVMKLPSPFKLSGAMAWGAAAGAAGGAASAGVSRMLDRKQGQASGIAKNAARRGGSAAISRVTGGKFGSGGAAAAAKDGRRGTAAPDSGKPGKGKLDNETAAPSSIAGSKRKGSGMPGKIQTDDVLIAGAAGVGAGVGSSRSDGGDPDAQPIFEETAPAAPTSIEDAEEASEPMTDDAPSSDVISGSRSGLSGRLSALEIPELEDSASDIVAHPMGAGLAGGAAAAVAGRRINRDHGAALKEDDKRQIAAEQLGMTRRERKLNNWNRQAGGLSPEDFIHSRVANSELAAGKMGHKDRAMLAGAQKLEKAAALKWERDRQIADGAPPTVGEALSKGLRSVSDIRKDGGTNGEAAKAAYKGAAAVGRAAALQRVERAKDNWAGLKHDMAQKPLATSKKVAGKTLKYGAVSLGVAAAFPFGIGIAATAGVGAAAYGVHQARKGAGRAQERTAATDATVDAYRAGMRLQQENAKEPKTARPRAKAQERRSAVPRTPVEVQPQRAAEAITPSRAPRRAPNTSPIPITAPAGQPGGRTVR